MRSSLLTFVAILLAFTTWASAANGWSSVVVPSGGELAALDSASTAIASASSLATRPMGTSDDAASPRSVVLARGGTLTEGDYRILARRFAADAGISPNIFERQIQVESEFDPEARSNAGAVGIAQIVPEWHPEVDATDPIASLQYAASLMASYLDNYHGDYARALAAYNAGPTAVARYGGVPPYWETRQYVWSILSSR